MIPKCYPGDWAVVIDAYNTSNIGTIVKIIGLHPNQSELLVPPTDALWTAQAPQPMTYDIGDQKVRRNVGPIPDSYLQPIRGEPMGQDIALLVELQWLRDREGELAVKQRVESYF